MVMRKLPRGEGGGELLPPPVQPQLNRRVIGGKVVPLVTQVRSYELITPLFGGGVEPGETDPVTIIRGPAIRGQLRFWWRACRGGRFNGDLAAMKDAEDKLWGAASTERKSMPSQVQITVEVTNRGWEEQPFERRARPSSGWRDLAYAAFPLQGKDEEAPGKVRVGVTFTLLLTYPKSQQEEIQAEIEAALWAWETFGGIGARTRRGFGALKLVSVDGRPVTPPGVDEVEAKIHEGLQKHVVSGTWPAGVPHLCLNPRMKVTGRYSDPKAAWEYLVKCIRDFRQSRPGASPRQPGRSRWPEPDEIRRLTDCRCDRHAKPLSTVRKFPRAAFGLPIVFHFKDEKIGDPYDTILQGRDYERLASPLILRPLACADGAVGLAVILEGTGVAVLPDGLILRKKEEADISWPVEATIEAHEAQKIPPLDGIPDVLQAFLKEL
ncbi:CRISPR-associated protein TM1795 family protein [Desulfofundulus kuznetsovii DSM 6115]|uniref:CRISPR-associated protein TM1795 family protein n=1 Tax=Desulfofundulus kuznetsovii (strain DSM 6115 / VKM B-1805 / 17) TaxID=760568 RepID=A0AAU8P8M3_DESK7|nr:CRISPR-associated protein TM1795 family protein [Desulfofundulus kuznetsovii DSM 6115]